ncbi:MAG: hypothetical protein ACQ9MH_18820 [Nitrospinales bacterium]
MSFADIISSEYGHICTETGDPTNHKLLEAVPLYWSNEKLNSFRNAIDLYFFIQIIV